MVDEDSIRREVFESIPTVRVETSIYTPAGRVRSSPQYSATVSNSFLGKERTLKGSDEDSVERKAQAQLESWAEQEVRLRIRAGTEDADADAQGSLDGIRGILAATLEVDDRIDWDGLLDTKRFPAFAHRVAAPKPPAPLGDPELPAEPFWSWLIPSLHTNWVARCKAIAAHHFSLEQAAHSEHAAAVLSWTRERDAAQRKHETEKAAFTAKQQEHNDAVATFRQGFETGEPEAVEAYIRLVFDRSSYPDGFCVEHAVAFDAEAHTAVVDIELPNQTSVPDIVGYKFNAAKSESKPIHMKPKEHDAFYDEAIKQTVVRTIHEVLESVYVPCVQLAVVNGWVTRVDPATGHDTRTCVISVSASRAEFEGFNLARVDSATCLKKLKALTAGPLSQIGPVKPILQFNREDARFIDARQVLDGLNTEQNLAEIPWEDFEHLVRELFGKMFSGDGAEVKVTQASRDQGVDAVAFDPDPIRGGKFVIQAKRYTKTVSVSAVRELFGTMINEGASKGILVTTASFGPDSREFAKDKPITLIDGANLVYLLEQHGYRIRLDVGAARANRATG